MREVVVVSGARTAVGNFGGTIKDIPAVQLGALVIKEAMKKAGLRPHVSAELEAAGAGCSERRRGHRVR